jgi:hypothetical protein
MTQQHVLSICDAVQQEMIGATYPISTPFALRQRMGSAPRCCSCFCWLVSWLDRFDRRSARTAVVVLACGCISGGGKLGNMASTQSTCPNDHVPHTAWHKTFTPDTKYHARHDVTYN